MTVEADYSDLPHWVRPGATCDYVSWTDTSSMRSVRRATVQAINKKTVRISYVIRRLNGTETPMTELVGRDDLRYRSGRASGGQLLPLGSTEARDIRAVAEVRNAAARITKAIDQRGRVHSKGDTGERLELRDIEDARAVLAEMEEAIFAARRRIDTLNHPGNRS
jgi:hypothetical protein